MPAKPQGTGTPGDTNGAGDGGGDEPQYMTVEDFNAAFTKRSKAFETSMQKLVDGAIAKSTEPLTTALAALGEKLDTFTPKPAGDGKGGDPPKPIDDHIVKGLHKKITELETRATQAEQLTAAEKKKTRDAELRQKTLEHLEANGFTDAARARKALTVLVAENRVRWSGENADGDDIVFRGEDNDEVDLASGVKSYAKSDDAKIFMPPKGTQGAGSRPGGAPPKKQGETTPLGETLAEFFTTER